MKKIIKKKSSSKKSLKLLKSKLKDNSGMSIYVIIVKSLLILIILFGLYYTTQSFSNKISLLAVSEDSSGNIVDGSIIELNLRVKAGSGKINVNLNTIQEIDTQISIINSQKIACELFELDCDNYDFYYDFKGSALVLKGPSASSAIAILVAKTINKEKLDDKTVITGSLNSGGIIGNVGGVEEKIRVAEQLGFKKALIPVFSDFNITENNMSDINAISDVNMNIEVIKVIDIIEAYNNFNGQKFIVKSKELDTKNYKSQMKVLSDLLCNRSLELKSLIDFDLIEINSTEDATIARAENSFNLSIKTIENENYYSAGSFCYNTNLNYRSIIEEQKELTFAQRTEHINQFRKQIDAKYLLLKSSTYKKNIQTINDFYVYLLLIDRLEEAKELIIDAQEAEVTYFVKENVTEMVKVETLVFNNSIANETNFNQTINNTQDISENILENVTSDDINNTNTYDINGTIYKNITIEKNVKKIDENATKIQREGLYSFALERYETVKLWEKLISHNGDKIKFDDNSIMEVCSKINREISIKSELIKNYGFGLFNEEINEQSQFSAPYANHYLCIYKGLELNGKINSILNGAGINTENQPEFVSQMLNLTKTRLAQKSDDNFPLIPYIYTEYATDLFNEDDFSSSMLYANYALSYADLNLYLEKEEKVESTFNYALNELLSMDTKSLVFIGAILVILGFFE